MPSDVLTAVFILLFRLGVSAVVAPFLYETTPCTCLRKTPQVFLRGMAGKSAGAICDVPFAFARVEFDIQRTRPRLEQKIALINLRAINAKQQHFASAALHPCAEGSTFDVQLCK
jgi:hypothetical protein